jgi:hypothetical protein
LPFFGVLAVFAANETDVGRSKAKRAGLYRGVVKRISMTRVMALKKSGAGPRANRTRDGHLHVGRSTASWEIALRARGGPVLLSDRINPSLYQIDLHVSPKTERAMIRLMVNPPGSPWRNLQCYGVAGALFKDAAAAALIELMTTTRAPPFPDNIAATRKSSASGQRTCAGARCD